MPAVTASGASSERYRQAPRSSTTPTVSGKASPVLMTIIGWRPLRRAWRACRRIWR